MTRSRYRWIVPTVVTLLLGGFLVPQLWPEETERPPESRPQRVDVFAYVRAGAELDVAGDRFDAAYPFREMARSGIRSIGRDFEGRRLCVAMSPAATEDQFRAVIGRLSQDPDIERVERLHGADRPAACGDVTVSE